MILRPVTSLVLKCIWQTLCHVPIYQPLSALQLKKRRNVFMQLISYPFENPSWLRSSVKLQKTQYYSAFFK